MSSTTTIPDTDVFPSISMPLTMVLTAILVFVIVAGFLFLFFWRFLLYRLYSASNLQQTHYADRIHVASPAENTGLDPIIIRTFPVFLYSSATVKDGGMECAICLSEFSDEDTVRLITVCHHAFHSICIDLWFESHKNCPVCRCELTSGSYESFTAITIQDTDHDLKNPPTTTSSSKRLTTSWRFSRSHSTGHFMVKTMDVSVKIKRKKHHQTGSCVTFDELTRYNEVAKYGMAW